MTRIDPFPYKNDGIKTVENDLSALAEQLPPSTFRLVYATVQKAVAPLLARIDALDREVSTLKDRFGQVETQQQTNIRNLEIAFSANITTKERVEAIENAPDKVGPGTEDQQEQIESYLKKKPDHRATYGELRDLLGVTKSRFSQIIRGASFAILQHRHDRRRRSLKLPAIF